MTQKDLWSRGGVQKSAQLGYEGDKRAPDARYLAAVAQAGVDVAYVVTGQRSGPHSAALVATDGELLKPFGFAAPAVSAGLLPVTENRARWGTPAAGSDSDDTNPGGTQGTGSGALLPVEGADEGWPLVLTLSLGNAGRKRTYDVIPKLMGAASAGSEGGGIGAGSTLQLDRVGDLAMSYEWLRRNMNHTKGPLASVQVDGDSMAPTLLDGETIVIDRGVCEVRVDGIYVIVMRGNRLVKRLQRKFDQSLVVISDNSAYERETIPRGWESEIEVLGRMVWPRVR